MLGGERRMALNDFQKNVVETFANTNDNLLIVAPTGSGKTYIAQYLAVKFPYDVLYVTPLKAIVYQVASDLKSKFNGFDNSVTLLSEAYEDDPDNINNKVIISTYEKADSVVRRPYNFVQSLGLLIIDEVHNVNDPERGKAIENLVVWARDRGIRIVAMSATVPFAEDVAKWLNARVIKSDYRPIPLYKYVRIGNYLYDGNEVINVKGDLVRKLVKNLSLIHI